MPAELYNIAYTSGANAILSPHPNFLDEGNTPKYVSTAVGGKRRRTKKRKGGKRKKTRHNRRL